MAVCEHHDCYLNYLNELITAELDNPKLGKQSFGRVWNVVQNTAICRSIENISPEEARVIYGRIYDLYPQFKEGLEKELEKGHFI